MCVVTEERGAGLIKKGVLCKVEVLAKDTLFIEEALLKIQLSFSVALENSDSKRADGFFTVLEAE